MPQSPRTRIKTIVGKERADRRDNCEIIENRMAISEFQGGASECKKIRSSRSQKESARNKENRSPFMRSDALGSPEALSPPPRPPRSPRIERSVLGDSPTLNKMNSNSLAKDCDAAAIQLSSSVCSDVTRTEERVHTYENSSSHVMVQSSLSSSKDTVDHFRDPPAPASPRDKSVTSLSGCDAAEDEERGSNKVLEEHIIKNIQDTFNIDVSTQGEIYNMLRHRELMEVYMTAYITHPCVYCFIIKVRYSSVLLVTVCHPFSSLVMALHMNILHLRTL